MAKDAFEVGSQSQPQPQAQAQGSSEVELEARDRAKPAPAAAVEVAGPRGARPRQSQELPEEVQPVPQWRLIWLRFRQHRLGMFSAVVLFIFILLFLFGEFVGPYNYNQGHLRFMNAPPTPIHIFDNGRLTRPYVCATVLELGGKYRSDCSKKYPIKFFVRGEPYKLLGLFESNVHLFGTGEGPFSPGQIFLFGTDWNGRDIFTRTLVGGRTTLLISLIVVVLSLLIGIPVGGVSGYRGGWTDSVVQKIIELFMGVPRLALLLALSIILDARQVDPEIRIWGISLLLALVSWAPVARVIRGQFLALREVEFVTAAQALGASDLRIVLKHILPNTMSYLIVTATLTIPTVIIVESTLSFLNQGIREPLVSWGLLLNVAMQQMVLVLQSYPWNLIPGVFIVVTVLLFNFLGDALRDALDPFTVVSETE